MRCTSCLKYPVNHWPGIFLFKLVERENRAGFVFLIEVSPFVMRFWLLLCWGLLYSIAGSAQTWTMPKTDLGVPKPQGPQIPNANTFQQEQAARARAYNQAAMDEVERYNARQVAGGGDHSLDGIQADIDQFQRQRLEQAQFNAEFETKNKRQYEAGYQALAEMLDGRRVTSLPLAVFIVENSYSAGELRYTDFKANLAELADICRGLAGNDTRPAARFMALHRLVTDTVQVTYAGKVISRHLPYYYDLEDFRGEKDFSKQFVTKLLRTNSGQCHSMPLLYKMVADQLGVRSYISMAPTHSFIQVKDERGRLYRYETTNGHFVTDAYYMTTGYIKAGALKAGAYLDTLTTKQVLAEQVLDLALGYEHYYGFDEFVDKCAALGLKYYPQGMQGNIIVYDAALARFNRAANKAAPPSFEAAMLVPGLKALWTEVERTKHVLDAMGFEKMPAAQYEAWLKSLDAEKNRQESRRAAARFQQAAR